MNSEKLMDALAADPLGRLRWRVCREFRVLPSSHAARRMNDRQVVACGAQMVLDRRECRGETRRETARNSSFDEKRFAALSEGGI